MVVIDLQNFVNFHRKLADFGPKTRHFFADPAKILKNFEKQNLRKNEHNSVGNAPIGLKMGKKVP